MQTLEEFGRYRALLQNPVVGDRTRPGLSQRIRTHSMICFMELVLYRIMRQRLKLAQSTMFPKLALLQLNLKVGGLLRICRL